MTPLITIVERTARVGILGHLDELEPLAKEYLADIGGSDDLNVRLTLSSFIAWLRQRQRQSVVRKAAIGTADDPLHPNNRRRG